MKKLILFLTIIFLVFYFYQHWTALRIGQLENLEQNNAGILKGFKIDLINKEGQSIRERIKVPVGAERIEADAGSFGDYLRNLPLKPHGSRVRYFNGQEKTKEVYVAVVDMEIGDRDL